MNPVKSSSMGGMAPSSFTSPMMMVLINRSDGIFPSAANTLAAQARTQSSGCLGMLAGMRFMVVLHAGHWYPTVAHAAWIRSRMRRSLSSRPMTEKYGNTGLMYHHRMFSHCFVPSIRFVHGHAAKVR